MNLLETLKECAKKANCRSVVYANMETEQEFQAIIEKFRAEEYPVMLIEQLTSNGTYSPTTGMRDAVVPLTGYVLTHVKQDTLNYRMDNIEPDIIEPMKKICKSFTKRLLVSGIVNPAGSLTDTITAAYQVTNKHLFGAKFSISLPVIDSCSC